MTQTPTEPPETPAATSSDPANAPPPTGPAINIDDWSIPGDELNAMEFDPVKMVVPGLLPVGLAIIAGKPKIGKSFLTLQMGLAVAEGTTFLGETMPQGDVLVFSMEDDVRRLQERALKLTEGDPIPSRFRLFNPTMKNVRLPEIEELINQWATQVERPSLVIIDTMVKVMPKKQVGQDDYAHNTQVLGGLQALALRLDICILLVHHESKRADNLDEFDAMLGSTGINGTADTLILLRRLRDMASGELSVTGRDLPEQMAIPLERDGIIWRKSGVKNFKDVLPVSPLQLKALQVVNERRADGSPTCKAGNIATALGKSNSHTSNILAELTDKGFLRSPSHGSYELAPGVAAKLSLLNDSGETTPATSVLDIDPMPYESFEFDFGD